MYLRLSPDEDDVGVGDALPPLAFNASHSRIRIALVAGPTLPSAVRPYFCCRALTVAVEAGPKLPSIASGNPSFVNTACTHLTSSPVHLGV